jgi:hypothetical protein
MAMENELEGVKRRVKKLLALSKSPNENEALAALEKARKLMDEYRLTEGECLYVRHSARGTKRLSRWRAVLSAAVAWLNYCETARFPATGEIIFYGEEFDAFMAGEMYRYLSKTIERMAKLNIRKTAKTSYREKYKLGVACQLSFRIHEMGDAAAWGLRREVKLLAVRNAMEGEFSVERTDLKVTGMGGAAFRRGAVDGNGISLNRQATGHGGRYLEGGKQ